MTDWTAGYVADLGYTHGYYNELNPTRIALALLQAGLALPRITTACELGFGQGLSLNLHAAASPVRWWGTDFNPSQAAFAQELTRIAGSEARVFDDAFADFAQRHDLPGFDFIALHGIWSWISDENRRVIAEFARRHLNPGGVLYISYNCFPGWAAFVPLRELLKAHTDILGAPGQGRVGRIDGAIGFVERLLATNPAYARENPAIAARFNKLKEHNRAYLAHEYFNRDWAPMSLGTMAEWLQPAKLDYAGSAHPLDAIDAIHLTEEQRTLLAEIPDPLFRAGVRNFMVNQQFRRDYWVKGPRRLNALEQRAQIRALRLVLTTSGADVPIKVTGTLGKATLNEALYTALLEILTDHQPRTFAQIEQALVGKKIAFAQLWETVRILAGGGHLHLAQDEAVASERRTHTDALNAHLMQQARGSDAIRFLASPVTGGGIHVDRFHQLFLLARQQGRQMPADWAAFVWEQLKAQGQRVLKEGKALESEADNLAHLTGEAESFAAKRLAVMEALQVA
ncbi:MULTISPECIES: class I SAM-dependent methyltransferase [Thiorhodovibrio]|uniref:class I SAM-dependent methyltransferase n=1 Tax=Thiorhodovibrio TaxID=61593 RepID=UPI0019144FB7|nr:MULTISPECIES: class I SAM-dependent methyltransferase [Thiorhodovibrio]MBK5969032.1 methyltransferase [Thiorhodovibrio winogradskyi]WPL15087.1 putative methyltransferase regulatory domain protein [Thiorhodovibrio litoralis]